MKLHIFPPALVLAASFAACPAAEPSAPPAPLGAGEYRTIMWIGDSAYKRPDKVPLFFERLREMGINTGMVYDGADPKVLVENGFPYYVENVVNRGLCLKWNSKVTDWDKFVTRWKDARDEAGMVRDYSLDDPAWRKWAADEMRAAARRNVAHAPVAYDIRDELSVTISANPVDYDFSPVTLAAFRTWLQGAYPDLAALNREWETSFASWDEVKPFPTDKIKNRMGSGDAAPRGKPDWGEVAALRFDAAGARKSPTRWNLSPWADFRTYMDISLASALGDIRAAAKEVDARAPVGIEGTQMPHAFGGYDLWRLSQVLDWVEPYDIGSSREIFGSFMPGKPFVVTVFESETNPALRRLWHLLLHGDKGCIVWWSEDCIDWKSPDYALTAKAKTLSPALKEMASPLARLFMDARRRNDPIAIGYSQASIQADWLIESCVDGSTWLRRFSSHEADHNRMAKVRGAWLKALGDLGWSPRFVSSEQIEKGALAGCKVLVLPTSRALSDVEAKEIRAFLERGGRVFADGTPGLFDAHCRLRTSSPLEDVFPAANSEARSFAAAGAARPAAAKDGDVAAYATERLKRGGSLAWAEWIAANLGDLRPEVAVPLDARIAVHRFDRGAARLLAFERNIAYQMSEDLKQAGGNGELEKPIDVEARLPADAHAYDLRARKYLGKTDRLAFRLDPWSPSLFALLEEKIPEESIVERLGAEK